MGYGGEGLSMHNLRRKPFETYRHDPNDLHSISTNTIISFNQTSDEVLIGTLYNGLISMKFDGEKQEFLFKDLYFPNDDYAESEGRQNAVWKISRGKQTACIGWQLPMG